MRSLAFLSRPMLLGRVRSTLRFLHDNIESLEQAESGALRADKAACEVALLCWGLARNRHVDPAADPQVRALLDACERRLRAAPIIQGLLWHPARTPMLAMGSALLSRMGRTAPAFDSLSLLAWREPLLASMERSPSQQLELYWSARLLGIEQAPPPLVGLLAQPPLAQLMRAEDGYALTHALFYITDFGRQPLPPAADAQALCASLESALAWSLARYDFDLLGECLLCTLYCGMPCTPLWRLAVAVLLLTWEANGFVPDRAPPATAQDAQGLFFSLYHANLVAALLASELLLRLPALIPAARPLPLPAGRRQALLEQLAGQALPAAEPAAAAQAPEPLLQALFGGPLLQRLQDLLDGDSLALATDDLRIAHALQRQDLPLLLQALASAGPSATLLDAAHWLAMARELLDQARGQPAPPGPLRQPLARLQALLQLQPGGATRPTLLRVRR